jgi:hypothetical protein
MLYFKTVIKQVTNLNSCKSINVSILMHTIPKKKKGKSIPVTDRGGP